MEVLDDENEGSDGAEKLPEAAEAGRALARAPQGLDDDFIAFSDSEDDAGGQDGAGKPTICAPFH